MKIKSINVIFYSIKNGHVFKVPFVGSFVANSDVVKKHGGVDKLSGKIFKAKSKNDILNLFQ